MREFLYLTVAGYLLQVFASVKFHEASVISIVYSNDWRLISFKT